MSKKEKSHNKMEEEGDHNYFNEDFFDWYNDNQSDISDLDDFSTNFNDTGQNINSFLSSKSGGLQSKENPKANSKKNSQRCTKDATLENIKNSKNDKSAYPSNSLSGATFKAHKRKVKLSPKARYLKNHFYLIFTNRKKFPKDLVKKIHEFIEKPLHLKHFSRNMIRSHDLYFKENAENCEKILKYLVENKQKIITQFPEINNYQ